MAGAFAVLVGIGIDSARNLESLISRAVMPWWAGGILFVAGWTASAMASEFAGVQEPDRIRMLASALQGGLIGLVALFAVRLTFKSRMEEALRLHQASSPDEGAMGSDNPGHA